MRADLQDREAEIIHSRHSPTLRLKSSHQRAEQLPCWTPASPFPRDARRAYFCFAPGSGKENPTLSRISSPLPEIPLLGTSCTLQVVKGTSRHIQIAIVLRHCPNGQIALLSRTSSARSALGLTSPKTALQRLPG